MKRVAEEFWWRQRHDVQMWSQGIYLLMSHQQFYCSAIKAIIFFIISTALSYTPSQRSRFIRDNCLSAEKFSRMSADCRTLIRKTDDALLGGLKICIISRGVPGRGKTTLVESIVRHYNDNGEFTATMSASDDFMIDSSGLISSEIFLLNTSFC